MIKKITTTLKPIFRLALFMSYPLLVLIVLGWFIMPFLHGYLKEIIAFFLLTLVSIALVVVIPTAKIKKVFSIFLTILLACLCFIKLSFYKNYAVKLNASALFVIFETNATEASDFLANYFNGKVIAILLLLVVVAIISIMQIKRFHFKTLNTISLVKIFALVGVISSLLLISHRFSNENLFLKSYNSYYEYEATKANLKNNLSHETSSNLRKISSDENEQTYVVVLGESASRWHMQLYGYDRETNPELIKVKEELLVYNDVITPNVHTIAALDKILTLSDYDNPNLKKNASIVQLANQAGFTTYWISNQKPVGIHESIPTLIASAANEKHFVSVEDYSYNVYDQALLPVLDSVLKKPVKKKLIFMHLIGNHGAYKRRYPDAFNYFNEPKHNANFKSPDALNLINEYDNSVRYNDAILSEILSKVKSKNSASYMLYLADHGDEVFDTIDFVGHSEYHATKPMYEVPFFVWFSDAYKLNNPDIIAVDNRNKPYVLEDFIHSFSEISHISFDGLNLEKSIFSSQFKPKTRYIKAGEDYDKR